MNVYLAVFVGNMYIINIYYYTETRYLEVTYLYINNNH